MRRQALGRPEQYADLQRRSIGFRVVAVAQQHHGPACCRGQRTITLRKPTVSLNARGYRR